MTFYDKQHFIHLSAVPDDVVVSREKSRYLEFKNSHFVLYIVVRLGSLLQQ